MITEDEELRGREDDGADELSRADVDEITEIANINNSNFESNEQLVAADQRNGVSQWNSEKGGTEDEESKTKTWKHDRLTEEVVKETVLGRTAQPACIEKKKI
ncbi:hypothetical protein PIB30_005645 [Stylosanthes scabra]|uniref:Uncharacterized protein n=1 Tax=Stylosanthes scabra TaxID=79078 RepID=A0ABU6T5Y6_9FABA|nr:hypothetical protein [Stylosanthes scabra]